ncbi:MAG: histidine kinase [Rikenellaceae bacterium]
MLIKILLIISIIIQLVAAATAISMIKQTRFNLSWILFTIALTIMAMSRFTEYTNIVYESEHRLPADFFVWVGVITSLCLAVGVLLVKRIFKYISRAEHERKITAQRILNTVVQTEERERRRFSKELHDGLGPLMASAKMSISALNTLEHDPRSQSIIDNASYVIDEAVHTLKEVANNMSPHILDNFGVAVAIQKFVDSISIADIDINYQTNIKEKRFDNDLELVLFRVACELLHNGIRHSNASQISITLVTIGSNIEMQYSDNGKGFDTKSNKFGLGLSNMESRVSTIGGSFNINSDSGRGVHAEIIAPI